MAGADVFALRDVWTSMKSKLNPEEVAAGERVSQKTIEMFAAMRRAGVKVLAGSDLPIRNGVPVLHEELLALVSVGMTPMAALQSATKNPAEFLGRDREEGTIEIGKKANLTVLDDNPLGDIANTRRVAAVVLAGKLLLSLLKISSDVSRGRAVPDRRSSIGRIVK